jgi:AcrR family transcriptional regulator
MRRGAARAEGAQRLRILEKSARLFADKGFEDTSINDIADEVDISKATIYHYFKSKEEIYTEIIIDTLERLVEFSKGAINPSDTPNRKVESFMRAHARFFEENFWAFTAMLIGFGGVRQINQRTRAIDLRDQYEATLRDIVREGIKGGEFRNVDPALAARAMLSMLNWMARWYKPGGTKPAHEFARDYASLAIFGLHTPALAPEPAAPTRPRRRGG